MEPAASVNSRIPPVSLVDAKGNPSLDEQGNQRTLAAIRTPFGRRPIRVLATCIIQPGLLT
jgi:hypothetical protein